MDTPIDLAHCGPGHGITTEMRERRTTIWYGLDFISQAHVKCNKILDWTCVCLRVRPFLP